MQMIWLNARWRYLGGVQSRTPYTWVTGVETSIELLNKHWCLQKSGAFLTTNTYFSVHIFMLASTTPALAWQLNGFRCPCTLGLCWFYMCWNTTWQVSLYIPLSHPLTPASSWRLNGFLTLWATGLRNQSL